MPSPLLEPPDEKSVLGAGCVLEPSFAAFRLSHTKATVKQRAYVGQNFSRPHRDYSFSDSIEAEAEAEATRAVESDEKECCERPRENATRGERLKVLSVWVPLNDVTLKNGCMFVVPKPNDPHFHDPTKVGFFMLTGGACWYLFTE